MFNKKSPIKLVFCTIAIFICIFIFGCDERIDKATSIDCGKIQIGENLYLKKILIRSNSGCDNVYLLVNGKDEIVSGTSNTYQVGKTFVTVASITK